MNEWLLRLSVTVFCGCLGWQIARRLRFPAAASGAPIPQAITRNVSQKKLSPIPASGPIKAILTELIDCGSNVPSGALAYSSSIAQVMPRQNGTKAQVVLNMTLCRIRASFRSSGSG